MPIYAPFDFSWLILNYFWLASVFSLQCFTVVEFGNKQNIPQSPDSIVKSQLLFSSKNSFMIVRIILKITIKMIIIQTWSNTWSYYLTTIWGADARVATLATIVNTVKTIRQIRSSTIAANLKVKMVSLILSWLNNIIWKKSSRVCFSF